jgi:hypothetical protein
MPSVYPKPVVFFVDWDDTLLPLSWLEGHKVISPETLKEIWQSLQALESRVFLFLRRLMYLGSVVIVTNSGEGWVQQSCAMYFPKLMALLEQVKIVSARTRHEATFPDDPAKVGFYITLLIYNSSVRVGSNENKGLMKSITFTERD